MHYVNKKKIIIGRKLNDSSSSSLSNKTNKSDLNNNNINTNNSNGNVDIFIENSTLVSRQHFAIELKNLKKNVKVHVGPIVT